MAIKLPQPTDFINSTGGGTGAILFALILGPAVWRVKFLNFFGKGRHKYGNKRNLF